MPPRRKQAKSLFKSPIKQKKRAAIFGGRPLLETLVLFQAKSGHPSRVVIGAHLRTLQFGFEMDRVCHAIRFYLSLRVTSRSVSRFSSYLFLRMFAPIGRHIIWATALPMPRSTRTEEWERHAPQTVFPEMMRWLWRDHGVSTDVHDMVERSFNAPKKRE